MKKFTSNDIDEMVNILKNNGVLAVPTDTIWGLCVKINSKEAFDKLVSVKNRPANKSFSIMCADKDQIKDYGKVSGKIELLIDSFLPGPLTIVLNKSDKFVNNCGENTFNSIGVRMATSSILKEIINKLGSPIFMTSANLSGESTCKTIEEIEMVFPSIDGILDGNVSFGKASTIIDCTSDDVKIVREGPITIEQIDKIIDR